MDLKQEPSDPYEGVVKAEPDVLSGQTEEDYWCSTKQEPFENDHNVLLGSANIGDNISVYKATEYFVNVSEIKEEIDECVVPKIEYQPSDSPEKECDSIQFVSATIKKECDVHDMVKISETKQEVSDSEYIQFKTERELLTTYCDLPTIKSENTEYSDNFVQPCSSKYTGITLKTTTNVISKKKKNLLYPCLICQKNFPSSKSRSKHISRHFGKRFMVCEFCGKLMTRVDFFRHYFAHVVKNRFSKVSLNNKEVSGIQQQLIIHPNKKPFNCDICFKKFIRNDSLHRHLQIHTHEKSFQCDICSKTFNKKPSLQKHLVIHTNEKPFNCNLCSKKFKRKFDLKLHLITHTNEKPFKCDNCFKEFKRRDILQRHLIIHNNEKSLKCKICFKEIKRTYGLQRHLIMHTDTKHFKCDICFKEFKRRYELRRHLIMHTDKKPFKCDICSKEFKRTFELQRHSKTHLKV